MGKMQMKNRRSKFAVYRVEDTNTNEDFAVLRFQKTGDRGSAELVLPVEDFCNPQALKRAALKSGFPQAKFNAEELQQSLPENAGKFTRQPGWCDHDEEKTFLLFKRSRPMLNDCIAILDDEFSEYGLGQMGGTLDGWKRNVADLAGRSYISATALLASLAAPLLPFSDVSENPILNLAGTSSTGKTTANSAALSVWGNPTERPTWNSSPTRMLELGALHNNLPLALDDLELADLKPSTRLDKLQEMTHLLSAGHSKDYAKAVKAQFRKTRFQSIILSSSPTSIELDQSKKQGRENSDRVRVLELSVPDGEKGGIWAKGPKIVHENTAELSSRLSSAAKKEFGNAGAAWISFLESHQKTLEWRLTKFVGEFVSLFEVELNSLDSRIAKKVGLFYAAGILAIEAQVLPWDRNFIRNCCKWALRDILQTAFPERSLADKIGRYLHKTFSSKYTRKLEQLSDAKNHPSLSLEAFVDSNTGVGYLRRDKLIKVLQRNGHEFPQLYINTPFVSRLTKRGVLLLTRSGQLTHTIRLQEMKARFLKFELSILEEFAPKAQVAKRNRATKERPEKHRKSIAKSRRHRRTPQS